SVGVQGDFRTYTFPAVLTLNDSDPVFNWEILDQITSFITNSCREVNRVILQLFEKAPGRLMKGYCTKKRLDMIREVDFQVLQILKKYQWYDKIFQHLTINLPYASQEDHCSIVLRPVFSEDVMTARFARIESSVLNEIVKTIEDFVFVDSLYYDITNKPPATFGWE
ncbi:MAG: glutamine-hydrolyzing GMP synthase, partial [Spirochaetes bacterium]|nr:glutamine-hydrolyzing GMP synthase [Spirochaetota bacterium]